MLIFRYREVRQYAENVREGGEANTLDLPSVIHTLRKGNNLAPMSHCNSHSSIGSTHPERQHSR